MLEQYFHRGYHQIGQGTVYMHQSTCRAKQAIAKQYWGTDIYFVPKILGHSYLVLKLGHSYLVLKILGNSYFSA